jgi:hypothetical protein
MLSMIYNHVLQYLVNPSTDVTCNPWINMEVHYVIYINIFITFGTFRGKKFQLN